MNRKGENHKITCTSFILNVLVMHSGKHNKKIANDLLLLYIDILIPTATMKEIIVANLKEQLKYSVRNKSPKQNMAIAGVTYTVHQNIFPKYRAKSENEMETEIGSCRKH